MIARRRRRLSDSGNSRTYEVSLDKMSKKDLDIIKYYTLALSTTVRNDACIDSRSYLTLLVELAKATGEYDRLGALLRTCRDSYVAKGDIVIDVRDSEARYDFEGDLQLSRSTDYYLDSSPVEADFIRCLSLAEENFYSKLIYNLFYGRIEVDTASDWNKNNSCRSIIKKLTEESDEEDSRPNPEAVLMMYFGSDENLNAAKKFELDEFKGLNSLPAKQRKYAGDYSDVKFLLKDLDLSREECMYLNFRYRKARSKMLLSLCDNLTENSLELYPLILNISDRDYQKVVSSNGKLRQYGFLDEDRCLNSALLEVISNQDLNLYFEDIIETVDVSSHYEPSTFSVPDANTRIHNNMLSSDMPVSILLYGNPGSGKTEYAKTLVSMAGKKAYIFRNTTEMLDKSEYLCRLNTLLSIKNDDSVVIVDEADSLLQTKEFSFFGTTTSSTKGLINKMLENSKCKTIWIVNYTRSLDDSTLRRFNISYKFNAMTPAMLESITNSKLEGLDLDAETKKQISQLISKYKIPGSSIANIVTSLRCMDCSDSTTALQNAQIVLEENNKLLHGAKNGNLRQKVSDSYDASVLNTDVSAEKILKMIQNAEKFAKDSRTDGDASNGIRMMFYGLSGTGKTEFARYISQQIGRPLLIKRCSDILDKYVGGTEQNIAEAFEEAANNGQILLFDEADSFFADRNGAQHSWERTQVNEFLTQMEEFPGILICTTNLRKIMDEAMLRRFHITVEFKPMKENGIRQLLNKYFSSLQFTEQQVHELYKWDSVTPGDFSRLASRIRFQDSDDLTSEYIMEELNDIQEEKLEGDSRSRSIGFGN